MKSSGSFNGGGDTVDEQVSSLASHCSSKPDTRESTHVNNKSRCVKKAMVCDALAVMLPPLLNIPQARSKSEYHK